MDNNWFYSTLAQSVAAIIGILSAFTINLIFNVLREYKENKERIKIHNNQVQENLDYLIKNRGAIRHTLRLMRDECVLMLEQGKKSEEITKEELIDCKNELVYDSNNNWKIWEEVEPQMGTKRSRNLNSINEFKDKMRHMKSKEEDQNAEIAQINDKTKQISIIIILNILLFGSGVVTPLIMLPTVTWHKIILLSVIGLIYLGFNVYLMITNRKLPLFKNTLAEKYSEDESIRKLIWEEE